MQVGNSEASETDISGCESIKQMSISADEIADSATHKSFIEKRIRHSSVPQTARPQVNIPSLSSLTKISFAFVIGVIGGKVKEGLINFVFFIIFWLFGPFNCVTIRKKQVWEIFK